MTGCEWIGFGSNTSQNTKSAKSAQSVAEIDFGGAENDVQAAIEKMKPPIRAGEPITVGQVKTDIGHAIEKLGNTENQIDQACASCPWEARVKAKEAFRLLNELDKTKLTNNSQEVTKLDAALKTEVQGKLDQAGQHLRDAAASMKSKSSDGQPAKSDSAAEPSFLDALIPAAKIIGAVLLLVLLAIGLMYLWQHSWKSVEINVARMVTAHSAAARDGQPDYTQKITSLSSAQKEMSNSLADLHTEIRSLARLVRESMSDRNDGRRHPTIPSYQNTVEEFSSKAEPEFPVSAFDYLGKMDRFANVVRPDFQNGILVNAPDGKGELMLIRDSRLPDETQPLFVVPRTTQFQTKQDFYTYYEKYYDCVRPSAGDVWIIDPAVVEKVSGGWQLREKGVLEVR
jgi:hypothetical protein